MISSTPLRKSDRTRIRIADAARALFSSVGFNGTSMRDIAERAGCDPALVIRYFGSKERLFLAVIDFDLQLPDLGGVAPKAAARALADHFVALWEEPVTGERFRTLLRSAASHEPAAERLRAVFSQQVVGMIASFRARKDGNDRFAAMAASVILGTAMTRYVLSLPPQVEIDAAGLSDQVAACLEPVFHAAMFPDQAQDAAGAPNDESKERRTDP